MSRAWFRRKGPEIFRYFFTYHLPDGVGFRLFSVGHIVWLAGIALAAALIIRKYRTLPPAGRRRLERILCWSVFSLEIIRLAFQIGNGGFSPDLPPLHLCGIAVYISLWDALRPSKIKREILYSLCMPGAAIALLFPAWTFYPLLNIFGIFCFLMHALLVIYPLMLFLGGEMTPDWRNLPRCLLFITAIQPPIYLYNRTFGTDFMFINGTLGVFPLTLFEKWFGNPGYILGIFLLLLLVWTLLYLPAALFTGNKKRSQKHEAVLSIK